MDIFIRILNDQNLDVLYVPGGYANSIQSLEENSKLLLMSDYRWGDIEEEYGFDSNYFTL